MDGQTDKHDVYRTITFNRSCNMLKVNPSEKNNHKKKKKKKKKSIQCQTYAKTEDHVELKLYFNSRHPQHTMENATFAHFMKKSIDLKTGFLSDYQVLFFILNGPQIETSL